MSTIVELFTVTFPAWLASAFQWLVDMFEGLYLRMQIAGIQTIEGMLAGLGIDDVSSNIEQAISSVGPTTVWMMERLQVNTSLGIIASALAARLVFVVVKMIL